MCIVVSVYGYVYMSTVPVETKGFKSPGAGVPGGCKPLCWDWNSRPLPGQNLLNF